MHFTQGYQYLLSLLLPFAVLLVSLPIVPLSGYVRTPGDHECHAWEAAAHLATLSTVVYGLCNNYVSTARQTDSTSYNHLALAAQREVGAGHRTVRTLAMEVTGGQQKGSS